MEAHPYRVAWRDRDLDAWAQQLAPDVALYSPIVTKPFRGRDAAVELFGVLFDTLGEIEITAGFEADGSSAFFWRIDVDGSSVEGVDLLHANAEGKIEEIRVFIRPLADIAKFAAAVGPGLAAKRGPRRAGVIRALVLPLRAILAIADRVSALLVQRS